MMDKAVFFGSGKSDTDATASKPSTLGSFCNNQFSTYNHCYIHLHSGYLRGWWEWQGGYVLDTFGSRSVHSMHDEGQVRTADSRIGSVQWAMRTTAILGFQLWSGLCLLRLQRSEHSQLEIREQLYSLWRSRVGSNPPCAFISNYCRRHKLDGKIKLDGKRK